MLAFRAIGFAFPVVFGVECFLLCRIFIPQLHTLSTKNYRKRPKNMRNNVAIRLTDQQEKFVRYTCDLGNIQVAARMAGYSESMVSEAARLLRSDAVSAAIRLEITRRLNGEALPVAYKVLLDIAKDVTAPAAVRRACARDLIDRAGVVPPKAADSAGNGGDKPMSDMTTGELRALVDRLESELGARAVDVSAPKSKTIEAKPLTFLD